MCSANDTARWKQIAVNFRQLSTRTSVTRWQDQFFNIWSIISVIICPIPVIKIAKICLKCCQIPTKPEKIMRNSYKILPKRPNFAKSGHTDTNTDVIKLPEFGYHHQGTKLRGLLFAFSVTGPVQWYVHLRRNRTNRVRLFQCKILNALKKMTDLN